MTILKTSTLFLQRHDTEIYSLGEESFVDRLYYIIFPNICGDKTVDIPNKIFSDTASDIDERNKGIQIYKILELASVCNKHSLPILHDLCI